MVRVRCQSEDGPPPLELIPIPELTGASAETDKQNVSWSKENPPKQGDHTGEMPADNAPPEQQDHDSDPPPEQRHDATYEQPNHADETPADQKNRRPYFREHVQEVVCTSGNKYHCYWCSGLG